MKNNDLYQWDEFITDKKNTLDAKLHEIYDRIYRKDVFWEVWKQLWRGKKVSDDVEFAFDDDYYKKTITNVRLTLLLLMAVSCAFAFLDILVLAIPFSVILLLRYGMLFFLIIPLLILSYTSFARRFMQPVTCLVLIGIGIHITLIIHFFSKNSYGYIYYYATLILLIISSYTVAQLRLKYASITGWSLLFCFQILWLLKNYYITNSHTISIDIDFIMSSMTICIANIVGMVGGYFMEVYRRRDFFQRRIIETEQEKSDSLLLNILPHEIAIKLKNENSLISEYYENASILFADLVNFTRISESMSPVELVDLLNEVFSYFDNFVDDLGLEKIKTIGDCYMAASGVPIPRNDHAHVLVELALKITDFVKGKDFLNKYQLAFRIGINSGPVVAGVIGRKKFLYDLWGDAVNMASRMESHGVAGKIQVTRNTYDIIKDMFICEPQGQITIKGKGEMEIWHVLRAR
ncbi:MAG: hypothetical protein HQK77_01510 [Desulfobacterales bacterium]|nr:hypothetical protein [Desulfobacterales bacterium]